MMPHYNIFIIFKVFQHKPAKHVAPYICVNNKKSMWDKNVEAETMKPYCHNCAI